MLEYVLFILITLCAISVGIVLVMFNRYFQDINERIRELKQKQEDLQSQLDAIKAGINVQSRNNNSYLIKPQDPKGKNNGKRPKLSTDAKVETIRNNDVFETEIEFGLNQEAIDFKIGM